MMFKNPLRRPSPSDPTDTPDLPDTIDYSSLSDNELAGIMVQSGLLTPEQVRIREDTDLIVALNNLPTGRPDYFDSLRGLMQLAHEGPMPDAAQRWYERLVGQAEADIETARRAGAAKRAAACTGTSSVGPDREPDMTVADWLRIRWASADSTARHALRALADTLAIPLPVVRRRQAGPKDSPYPARSESELGRDDGIGIPAEREPKQLTDHADGPQWHDDHAPGWEPCTTLHDALHPENRGWY